MLNTDVSLLYEDINSQYTKNIQTSQFNSLTVAPGHGELQ